jgi:hypothetical protein
MGHGRDVVFMGVGSFGLLARINLAGQREPVSARRILVRDLRNRHLTSPDSLPRGRIVSNCQLSSAPLHLIGANYAQIEAHGGCRIQQPENAKLILINVCAYSDADPNF